jgi:hypothetical protein
MRLKFGLRALPLIAGCAGLVGPGVADALTITFSSGRSSLDVVDGTTRDKNGETNVVSWSGTIGGWDVYFTTGLLDTNIPLLQVVSFDASTSGSDPLTVSVFDDGVSVPAADYLGHAGGTLVGNDIEVSYSAGPGSAGPVTYNTSSFSGDTLFSSSGGSGMRITMTTTGGVTGVSATLQPVPIPAAAWLFGSALIGVVAVGRRKA